MSMRRWPWLAGLFLALLPAPAWAQVTSNFGGADPTRLVNQPILVPASGPQPAAGPPRQSWWAGSWLSNLLTGSRQTPTGGNPNPRAGREKGQATPRAFGFSRPAPAQP
jgi:hypothetical protein